MTEPKKRAFSGTMIAGSNPGTPSPPDGEHTGSGSAGQPAPGAPLPHTFSPNTARGVGPDSLPQPAFETHTARGVGLTTPGQQPIAAPWAKSAMHSTMLGTGNQGIVAPQEPPLAQVPTTTRGVGGNPDAAPFDHAGPQLPPQPNPSHPPTLASGYTGMAQPPVPLHATGNMTMVGMGKHPFPTAVEQTPARPDAGACAPARQPADPLAPHGVGAAPLGGDPEPTRPRTGGAASLEYGPKATLLAPPGPGQGSPAPQFGRQTLFGVGAAAAQHQVTQRSEQPTATTSSTDHAGQPWSPAGGSGHATMPSASPGPPLMPGPFPSPAPYPQPAPHNVPQYGAEPRVPGQGLLKATLFGMGTAARHEPQSEALPPPGAALRGEPQHGALDSAQPLRGTSKATLFGIGRDALAQPQPQANAFAQQAALAPPGPGQYGSGPPQQAFSQQGAGPGANAPNLGGPQYGSPPQNQPQYGAPPQNQPQYGAPPQNQPQYGAPPQNQPQYGAQPLEKPQGAGAPAVAGADFPTTAPPVQPFSDAGRPSQDGTQPVAPAAPYGAHRETMHLGPQPLAVSYGSMPPHGSTPPPAGFPGEYSPEQRGYSSAPPAPVAAMGAASVGAQEQLSSPPPAQSLPPKNSRSTVLLAVGAVVVAAMVVAAAGAVYLWKGSSPRPRSIQAAAPTAPATEAALMPQAAATEAAPSTPEPGAAPNAAAAPTVGGAEAAAPADSALTQEPALGEPSVQLECSPPCVSLQSVVCDQTEAKVEDGSLALAPGKHSCIFSATGYASRRIPIEIKAGEPPRTVSVVLARLTGKKKESCGTFINPCN